MLCLGCENESSLCVIPVFDSILPLHGFFAIFVICSKLFFSDFLVIEPVISLTASNIVPDCNGMANDDLSPLCMVPWLACAHSERLAHPTPMGELVEVMHCISLPFVRTESSGGLFLVLNLAPVEMARGFWLTGFSDIGGTFVTNVIFVQLFQLNCALCHLIKLCCLLESGPFEIVGTISLFIAILCFWQDLNLHIFTSLSCSPL